MIATASLNICPHHSRVFRPVQLPAELTEQEYRLGETVAQWINHSRFSAHFRARNGAHYEFAHRLLREAEKIAPQTICPTASCRVVLFPEGGSADSQKTAVIFCGGPGGFIGALTAQARYQHLTTVQAAQYIAACRWGGDGASGSARLFFDGRSKDACVINGGLTLQDLGTWLRVTWAEHLRHMLLQLLRDTQMFNQLPRGDRQRMFQPLAHALLSVAEDAAQERFNHLQPNLVAQPANEFRTAGFFSLPAYNFAVAGASPEARIRRARWTLSFPSFFRYDTLSEAERRAIDRGDSFVIESAHKRAVSSQVIRLVRAYDPHKLVAAAHRAGLNIPSFYANDVLPLEALIKIIAALPQGCIPDLSEAGLTTAAGRNFALVLVAAHRLVRRVFKDDGCGGQIDAVVGLMQHSQGLMPETAAQVRRDGGEALAGCADLISACGRILSWAPYVLRHGVPPNARDWHGGWGGVCSHAAFAPVLFRGRSLGKLLHLSAAWHKQFGRRAVRETDSIYLSWLALIPEQQAPNGCRIIPLTDSTALAEEGEAMHHCVGGYSSACAISPLHIFSIRGPDGRRLSTLTITEAEGAPPQFTASQNLSCQNQAPHQSAKDAAAWLVKELNTAHGTVRPDLAAIRAKRKHNSEVHASLGLCGVDLADQQAVNRQYQRYRVYLPQPSAAPTFAQFCELPEVTQMLTRMRATFSPPG